MREPYICQYCDQRSTRWWNLKIHMKRKHGEYSLDRSSGQYTPNNSFWYKHNTPYHNFGGTLADSLEDSFQHRYLPQQGPPRMSQNFANPLYRPTMEDQSYGPGLSQDTIVKIEQLKRLLNKHHQYFTNPNEILTWTVHWAVNGDNKILDENLEQLYSIDTLANTKWNGKINKFI